MKRIIAVVLIIVLTAPPALAGQKQPKPIDWQKLKAGTNIVLTMTGGQSVTERVLFVNEFVLVTRRAAPPKLPKDIENALLDIGSYWPAVFDAAVTGRSGRVRASLDGVFDGDKRLAELTDVVRRTPRGDVLTVAEAPHSHVVRNIVIVAVAVFAAPFIIFGIACRGGGC